MNNESIKAFKNEIQCYNYYNQRIKEINNDIKDTYYLLSNVKAIRYDKVKTTYNKEVDSKIRDQLSRKIEELEQSKVRYETQINHLNKIIKQCNEDIQKIIIDIYANGMKFEDVANEYNSSVGSIQYQITQNLIKCKEY